MALLACIHWTLARLTSFSRGVLSRFVILQFHLMGNGLLWLASKDDHRVKPRC